MGGFVVCHGFSEEWWEGRGVVAHVDGMGAEAALLVVATDIVGGACGSFRAGLFNEGDREFVAVGDELLVWGEAAADGLDRAVCAEDDDRAGDVDRGVAELVGSVAECAQWFGQGADEMLNGLGSFGCSGGEFDGVARTNDEAAQKRLERAVGGVGTGDVENVRGGASAGANASGWRKIGVEGVAVAELMGDPFP